jgi:hypothetical protein
MVWWKTHPVSGRYLECLVKETDEAGAVAFRHWSAVDSVLYNENGETIEAIPHDYGRVPIVRVFDKRHPRFFNVGVSRYEAIAEIQREVYNKESELILTAMTEAHPLIQAPEEYCSPENEVPLGPGFLLPKKKINVSGGGNDYEPWEYLTPPSGPSDSIRADQTRMRDAADRAARLTKPAGSAGTTGGTVAQSGVSKELDQKAGNALLARIAANLQKAERDAAECFAAVRGFPDADAAIITYPQSFSLLSAKELAEGTTEIQGILEACGNVPEMEIPLVKKLARELLIGEPDDVLTASDKAIEEFINDRFAQATRERETPPAPPTFLPSVVPAAVVGPGDSGEDDDDDDST